MDWQRRSARAEGPLGLLDRARESGGLDVELVSTVESYYGDSIRALISAGCDTLGLTNAKVRVEDGGAYPWVMMARLEALRSR